MKIQVNRLDRVVWLSLHFLVGYLCLGRDYFPLSGFYTKEEVFLSSPSVLARGGDELEETKGGVRDLDIRAWPKRFTPKNIGNQDYRAKMEREIVAILKEVVRVDYGGDWGRVTPSVVSLTLLYIWRFLS
jgi:hypothetical protein